MARCDDMWAQGWSEPNAGSDMAAISSRAIRDGDEYVLNGQKTWSTRALFANWLFGLFRSDPQSSRHHGLSYLLVPLDAKGITIRRSRRLNGKQAFAEVFFDDVRVSAANRIGDEGQGWNVAMATAGFERGLLLRSPARFQRTARATGGTVPTPSGAGRPRPCDPRRGREGLDGCRGLQPGELPHRLPAGQGRQVGAEASTNKIFWSELDLQMHETAMRILGPRAELIDDPEVHDWLEGFLFAQAGPIYAGTNEIQRNIIAERMLGLPKS